MRTELGDNVKVYIVRKYNKLTRWDCNHSTTFEEFEFPTKSPSVGIPKQSEERRLRYLRKRNIKPS